MVPASTCPSCQTNDCEIPGASLDLATLTCVYDLRNETGISCFGLLILTFSSDLWSGSWIAYSCQQTWTSSFLEHLLNGSEIVSCGLESGTWTAGFWYVTWTKNAYGAWQSVTVTSAVGQDSEIWIAVSSFLMERQILFSSLETWT